MAALPLPTSDDGDCTLRCIRLAQRKPRKEGRSDLSLSHLRFPALREMTLTAPPLTEERNTLTSFYFPPNHYHSINRLPRDGVTRLHFKKVLGRCT